ncbi:hypothetical protein BDCR2A_01806 [Borrelia duttonii CR2A]|uniref:Uncharacterized protein n=1 Tax=Borrelia duttonii CR2A TaxID=1432657 RepID=W6TW03_9SPIR|nr:hypothetical protein BDCR2A_01806 [Borrelia duttonii CR2A]
MFSISNTLEGKLGDVSMLPSFLYCYKCSIKIGIILGKMRKYSSIESNGEGR